MRPTAPTKTETALLPPFPGLELDAIHVPTTVVGVEQALAAIQAAGGVGFDTESKPTFRPGEVVRGPHVVQFALADRAFIFQMSHRESRAAAAELMESDRVTKVGFGLSNDRGQIRTNLGVTLRAIVDLDHVFRKKGYGGQVGVRAAVGLILGLRFHKSKRVTTSNWAAPSLTPAQLLYAANDAYAALRVMQAMGPLAELTGR